MELKILLEASAMCLLKPLRSGHQLEKDFERSKIRLHGFAQTLMFYYRKNYTITYQIIQLLIAHCYLVLQGGYLV